MQLIRCATLQWCLAVVLLGLASVSRVHAVEAVRLVSDGAVNAEQVELIVQVEGAQSNTGKVFVAVLNSAEAYQDDQAEPVAQGVWPVQNKKAEGRFQLPPGVYAIRLFHDENNNGTLDTNLIGIPTEPFGFSNNASVVFGPPSFDKVKVEIKEGQKTLVIRLKG